MGAKEWGLLLVLSLLWGGSFFFYKVLVAALPPVTVVLGRVGLAAIALNLGQLLGGGPLFFPYPQWRRFLLLALLTNVVPFVLIAWGETHIASGLASILNCTTPIFTVIVAHFFTKDEKFSPGKIAGVVCGFLGVLVLIGPVVFDAGAASGIGGEVAVLAASMVYGFAGVYSRGFKGMPPIQAATGQLTAATLILLPFSLAIDRPWQLPMPGWTVWAAWLAIALISTALAYIVYYRLLATAAVTNVTLVTLLLPVNALLLGALFLGEQITWRALAGMALICFGLVTIDGRALAWLGPRQAA